MNTSVMMIMVTKWSVHKNSQWIFVLTRIQKDNLFFLGFVFGSSQCVVFCCLIDIKSFVFFVVKLLVMVQWE